MADSRLTDAAIPELTTAPAPADLLMIVRPSDTTQDPAGSTYKTKAGNFLSASANLVHTHAIADITNLQATLDAKIASVEKGVASGVATLGADGKVPVTQLPSTTTPDATTTAKGVVQLAGDLGGTAVAPTVPGLANKANTTHSHAVADITATGTPSSTTFLRGDGSWAAVSGGTSSVAWVESIAEADALPANTLAIILAPLLSVKPVNTSGLHIYNSSTNTITTATISLSAKPTAGRLLVLGISIDKASGTINDPVGWTRVHGASGLSISHAVWHRVADGTETSVAYSWATAQRGTSAVVLEYNAVTSTILASHLNPYSDTAATNGTSGPTTAITAAGLAIGFQVIDSAMPNSSTAVDTRQKSTINNGFTWIHSAPVLPFTSSATSEHGTPVIEIAAKLVPSGDTPSVNFAFVDTKDTDQVMNSIVVYAT